MKQGFKFSNGKTAYSADGLRRLCQDERNEAAQHLNNGYIEQWLDYIGETKLADIAYQIKTNQITDPSKTQIEILSDYLDRHITSQKILDILDKNKSVDGLYRLCKEYPLAVSEYLEDGYIEQWLDQIGETDLANIAYQIRTSPTRLQIKSKINTLTFYLNKHIYLQRALNIVDVNKSIDIILKEYEMLRNEILNLFQNRIQIITLGLAAIFTLVGLGLAPLTDFLTTDKITFNYPVSITVKETQKIENKVKFNFDINQKSGQKLLIEKTIKENKIAGAAIPSIIIFSWLIPLASIYIMYSYLNWTQQIAIISEYISHNIEKKLFQLNLNLPESRLRKKISKRNKLMATPLSWESYMKIDPRSKDVAGFIFMFLLFSLITILSIIGGTIILYFDFSQENQAKGFEQVGTKVLCVLRALRANFTQEFANYLLLIILVVVISTLLYFFWEKSKKCIHCIGSDFNWLWFSILLLIIFWFGFHLCRGIMLQGIKARDFWLFVLPVTIWAFCLVRTFHQIIYTWRIRSISRNTLKSQKYLEQLWN